MVLLKLLFGLPLILVLAAPFVTQSAPCQGILTPASSTTIAASLEDLPIIAMKGNNPALPMLLYITGDGGWNSFNKSLVTAMVDKGYSVVALDAKKYFWKLKTPEQSAEDVHRIIQKYHLSWQFNSFAIIGYSFGASVVPFIANRLPVSKGFKLTSMICLSPEDYADFEVSITGLFTSGASTKNYPVIKEAQQFKGPKSSYIFGTGEPQKLIDTFKQSGLIVKELPGGHKFNNNFTELASNIVLAL